VHSSCHWASFRASTACAQMVQTSLKMSVAAFHSGQAALSCTMPRLRIWTCHPDKPYAVTTCTAVTHWWFLCLGGLHTCCPASLVFYYPQSIAARTGSSSSVKSNSSRVSCALDMDSKHHMCCSREAAADPVRYTWPRKSSQPQPWCSPPLHGVWACAAAVVLMAVMQNKNMQHLLRTMHASCGFPVRRTTEECAFLRKQKAGCSCSAVQLLAGSN
jgi:hypothetical protein